MNDKESPASAVFCLAFLLIFISFFALLPEVDSQATYLRDIAQDGENEPETVRTYNNDLAIIDAIAGDLAENGEAVSFTVHYDFSAPLMEEDGEFHVPVMSNLRHDGLWGMPLVPVANAQILLPPASVVNSIHVLSYKEASLEGNYVIKPAGNPMTFSSLGQPHSVPEMDHNIYSSVEKYPGTLCSGYSIQSCRGYQILLLKVYPLQYIPALGKVQYYQEIDVVVNTVATGMHSPMYRGLQKDRTLVENMVDNPDMLGAYELKATGSSEGDITPASMTNASESYSFLIITNSTLAPTFQLLADHRNTTGIETVVICTEDILADSDYIGDDDQDTIRNFIIDAYINWSIDYVLLGGDDEIIPHRGCYGWVNTSPDPTADDDIPTDLYYAGLDGDWDDDGDGIFGEKIANSTAEESDLYAEVFVGRAPVNSIIQAQTFKNKVMFFEANPRPKHVTLHGQVDSSGPYYLDDIKNGDHGPHVAPGVESYIPSTYNITRLYESRGHAITKAIWETEIANNTLFVNHGGHGLVQSYMINETNPYVDTDADDVLNTYYPIHLSIACYSGAFDGRTTDATPPYSYVPDKDCIAEEYITNPNGGMVACILNSRYGWFLTGDVSAYSGELDNEFYDQLFNNNIYYIGKTLQKAKEEFAVDVLTPDPWGDHEVYRWVLFEWNLLGDPTMKILGTDVINPVADAGPDNATNEDSPIVMDGSGSTDNSGQIAWYNWSFGDGGQFNGEGPANAKMQYTYTEPGYYTAELNVSDAFGNWDTDTVNITVFDATPPVTNLTIGVPKYRANASDDWNVTSATTFSLSAYDEYSVLNYTWYSIDGDFYVYATPFDLGSYGGGVHILTYGSEDTIGNNDTGTVLFINVDDIAPFTTLAIGAPKHGDGINSINVSSATQFIINSIDNYAGTETGWFYVDTMDNYFEATIFDLNPFGEGTYTLHYGARDNLGNNMSIPFSIMIFVDDSKPVTGLSIGNPKFGDEINEINVTSTTLFTLSSSDGMVGVNFTWYTIGGDYYIYSGAFNFAGYGEGVSTLIYGSEDLVENNETGTLLIIKVDDSGPTTSVIIGNPKSGDGIMDINVTTTTQFTLDAVDNSAGTETIWWYVGSLDYYSEITAFDFSGFGEGTYTLFYGAQDKLGNNATVPSTLTVFVDDTPPSTILTIGDPKYGDPLMAINVTPFTLFTLAGTDPVSGLDTEWFYINDIGNYTEGNTLDFTDYFDGSYILFYGSRDNLGNNETGNMIDVFVDSGPPTSDLEIGEPSYKQSLLSVTESTPFSINSSDLYSGIAFSWYTIDGDYYEGTTFILAGYGEGIHTIYFGAEDNLLNNKTEIPLSVHVDMTPPNSTIEIGDPKYRDDPAHYWNVTGEALFMILSEDDYSGVDTAWYLIDDQYFEGPAFTMAGADDGMHIITFGARDRLGNNETANMTIVFADLHSPVTDYVFSGLTYRREDIDLMNITSDTTITLSGADNFTGLNYTWFTIDGIYGEDVSFNLSGYGEGIHIITWGSVDFAGNNETGNIMTVVLDDSPPYTEITMGVPRYRRNTGDEWNVTSATTFTLTAQENYSGVAMIWYTIDGHYYQGQEFNLSGFGDGLHTITWGAVDNMNHNETGHLLIVYLDDTVPSTDLILGDPKYRKDDNNAWNITQSTSFEFVSNDVQSKVAFTWYTIDDNYHKGEDFLLSSESHGLHIITYGAQDNLGNNETASSITIYLDRLPPSANITIGNMSPESGDRVTTNSSTPVTLYATDGNGTGVAFIWYSLDGGTTYRVYDSQFTLDQNITSIIFGAQDLIGHNSTSINIRVTVDDREPVIDEEPEEPEIVEEEPRILDQIMAMLIDYLFIIIIIVIVVIMVVALSKMRKKKEEPVAFETEEKADDGGTTFVMKDEGEAGEKEEESEEGTVTFEQEEKDTADDAAVEWGK